MTRLAYYIDSHGFGHATRSMALIEALPASWEITLRTNAPRWLFETELFRPFVHLPSQLDIHPCHSRGYRIDAEKTCQTVGRKLAQAGELIETEARWLAANAINMVISDISPLAIRAAKDAGIPSFGVSNFTWDWILEPVFQGFDANGCVDSLRAMMAEATENFRLPFSDPETFPSGSVESPLLVRKPRRTRRDAREYFQFTEGVSYLLLTFGGIEGPLKNLNRLRDFQPIQFVQVSKEPSEGDSCELVRHSEIPNLWELVCPGLYHPDLVEASDGAVTKPGYGILSECMAASKPIVLDAREDFREFHVVKKIVAGYPQVAIVDNTRMETLNIGEALDAVLSSTPRPWRSGTDGASFVADEIVRRTN
jgi:hypothetical protein